MAEISWVKIRTDMFDNEKIKLIEALPEADTIIVIWVKLISYAGKVNSNGYIMLTENIPMNIEEISTIFGRPLNTVRLALETFVRYGMVTLEGEMVRIKNWDEHQNVDGMERVRKLNKERQQRNRDKKKLELPMPKADSNVTVTLHNGTELDLELDLELDKEKDKPLKTKKRAAKQKVEKPVKKQYAEFVNMTEDEHGKLVTDHGEKATSEIITILDNYKGASGKKYTSDYRAILNWVIKRYQEESTKGGKYASNQSSSQRASNFPTDIGF